MITACRHMGVIYYQLQWWEVTKYIYSALSAMLMYLTYYMLLTHLFESSNVDSTTYDDMSI